MALNFRDHSGDVSSAVGTPFKNLTSSLRACCCKFPPTKSHHRAPLNGRDLGPKALVRI
jgi:hypothetical protein